MSEITRLLKLRVLVGYLGEKSQFGWWQSDFFGPASDAFLEPIFPRTRFLSQVEGSSAAARLQHDDRIGKGDVYHLFRLPEDVEQSFHQQLQDAEFISKFASALTSKEDALGSLEEEVGAPESRSAGPLLAGSVTDLKKKSVQAEIGRAYLAAFGSDQLSFPYMKGSE